MGCVWLANDLACDREVAVKFLSPDHPGDARDQLRRFAAEARTAARVRHPHVVKFLASARTPLGAPYLVMERLRGQSVAERLRHSGPMEPTEVGAVMRQTAAALTRAHELGIVHRDIKPENLFLIEGARQPFVKVLDFGLALDRAHPAIADVAGALVGTPAYLSPELLLGRGEATPQADLWALAVTAHAMLTQRLPFEGATPRALLASIRAHQARLAERWVDLSQAINRWLSRAFLADPALRFRSAQEAATSFAEALVTADVQSRSPCLSDDHVLAFIQGQLAVRELRAADEHLDTCEDCREWVGEMAVCVQEATLPGLHHSPCLGTEATQPPTAWARQSAAWAQLEEPSQNPRLPAAVSNVRHRAPAYVPLAEERTPTAANLSA
jgi:serine/threonine protein kinase